MSFDPHSFSKPDEVCVKHLTWKATINFAEKTIKAVASWQIYNVSGALQLVVDIKGLIIKKVTTENGQPADFKLGVFDSLLGQAMEISISKNTQTVIIEYETTPDAEALQWLSPAQTTGKNNPFLFTQSQAILARSWIPCQDSPGVRFTYEAEIQVPKNLLPLMSASNPQQKNERGVYTFEMKQPIPSYLMALAVGDVSFESISERSGVYAESSQIKAATWEFADLEKMISAAEELYGKYQWERYDVLVLPPSFPFGGMENPRLTFATPTIIAGDKSLTSLIAHELAHSWSGNLVTNATWNDFWLNEGFTVYFETRIMEKLYGTSYSEMLASLNKQELLSELRALKEAGNWDDTRLKLNLEGRNPDEGVTAIAYNKGYFFLRTIEENFGRDKFDVFVHDYFSENAFDSMSTEIFIPYLINYYGSTWGIVLENTFLTSWIYTEGLPHNCPVPNADRFNDVDKVLSTWSISDSLHTTTKKWSTHEWLHFLKNLPDSLTNEHMERLDTFGSFTISGNAEIIAAWSILSIRNQYEKAYPYMEAFLINTGRRKFILPIYAELIKTDKGKIMAHQIYKRAKPNYHFVATNSIDRLINSNN